MSVKEMQANPAPSPVVSRYTVMYRLNAVPPPEIVRVLENPDLMVSVIPAPFAFSYSVPIHNHSQGAATLSFASETRHVTGGTYLALTRQLDLGSTSNPRAMTALPISEVVAGLSIAVDHLIGEKIFEGILNEPGLSAFFPEGPLSVSTAVRTDPATIGLLLGELSVALEALPPDRRDRFRLVARWYMRGLETKNEVDKFLYWYIALEVYPTQGEVDVPRAVRDCIHDFVYPDVDAGVLKERIGIGRIAGLRASIVHEGKSFVDYSEHPEFSLLLEKLRAIVVTTLRILANLSSGTELDRWVRDLPADV